MHKTWVLSWLFSFFKFAIGSGIISGADPGFFLGGGALVSTSTPISHIAFSLAEYQLY